MADTAWMDRAACRGLDPGLFHPVNGEGGGEVRRVCRSCPVRADCLEYALTTPETRGTWGGVTESERKRIRGARLREASCG